MTQAAPKRTPLLLIGLDAAEPRLIEEGMADGTLPHLRRLRERGAYGRLASTAEWLAGSPWPTFFTGTTPADHGFYHYLIWRPDRMAAVRPSRDWLPLEPFWRPLAERGARVAALDVPLVFEPEGGSAVEISGWANHERLGPWTAYPHEMRDWVLRDFGPSIFRDEACRLFSPDELQAERDELVADCARVGALAEALWRREPWDLFLAVLSAPHRGGHKLWDLTGCEAAGGAGLEDALRRVYVACDEAVGKLVAAAGEEATSFVFSLHGMGPNTSRAELVQPMLQRVLAGNEAGGGGAPAEKASTRRKGLAARLRGMLPARFRHHVKRLLPAALQDRLTTFWRMGGIDWRSTRAAGIVADLQGYVRLNVRGREAQGIVEPGREYDELCRVISEGLAAFVDADTGEPVVEAVRRADELYPEGARSAYLPDLIVKWAATPAASSRAIASGRYGTIPLPAPGKNLDGRSGNHGPEGFVIAAGAGIAPGSDIGAAHILDLAPTIFARWGLPPPAGMRGAAIPALAGSG